MITERDRDREEARGLLERVWLGDFERFVDAIAQALAARERAVREEYEYVGNLLAVIHGDGGHYISDHGWKKATDDAITKWYASVQSFIDAGLADAEGKPRKVLGTLPLTADGCIAGAGAKVWGSYWGGQPEELTLCGPESRSTPWEGPVLWHGTFSTREAALAAKERGQ